MITNEWYNFDKIHLNTDLVAFLSFENAAQIHRLNICWLTIQGHLNSPLH